MDEMLPKPVNIEVLKRILLETIEYDEEEEKLSLNNI
jgi:hypothetical protein